MLAAGMMVGHSSDSDSPMPMTVNDAPPLQEEANHQRGR